MTDDIVTRLRRWHDQRDSWQTLTEAADEIERLRAGNKRWRELADRMYVELVKDYCWHCGHEKTRNCYANDAVEDYRYLSIESGVNNGVQS